MREITIAGQTYGDSNSFVIAEAGHNHGGAVGNAKQIARAASVAGASAVKFQTRTPKEVYQANDKRGAYFYESDNPQWMDKQYGKHRVKLEFTEPEWRDLYGYCKHELKIPFISTPFDFKSADLLEELGVPAYKIASGDATNVPLLRHVAKFDKPMIVSTGGCSMEDVRRIARELENRVPLAILQCSCVYPARADTLNLRVIETYRREFPGIVIGLSSHYPDWNVNIAAWMLGARIFENHFTVSREWKGTDNPFSLTPPMMEDFIKAIRACDLALGKSEKFCQDVEKAQTEERRKSIVWRRDLKMGHVVTADDITYKCPGDGIEPYKNDEIIGSKLARSVITEDTVRWSDIRLRDGVGGWA